MLEMSYSFGAILENLKTQTPDLLRKAGKKLTGGNTRFTKHIQTNGARKKKSEICVKDTICTTSKNLMINSPARTAPSPLSKRRPNPQVRPETRALPRQGSPSVGCVSAGHFLPPIGDVADIGLYGKPCGQTVRGGFRYVC